MESVPGSVALSLHTVAGSIRGGCLSLCLCLVLLSFVVQKLLSALSFFFFSKGISPYVGIDLVCLWRGGSSGSSSITIWTLSLESICFDCQDDYNLPSYVNVCIRKYSKGWSVLSKCSK